MKYKLRALVELIVLIAFFIGAIKTLFYMIDTIKETSY